MQGGEAEAAAATTGVESGAESGSEEQSTRFAPSEILEDGSMVYTMSLLQSIDYETVLAP